MALNHASQWERLGAIDYPRHTSRIRTIIKKVYLWQSSSCKGEMRVRRLFTRGNRLNFSNELGEVGEFGTGNEDFLWMITDCCSSTANAIVGDWLPRTSEEQSGALSRNADSFSICFVNGRHVWDHIKQNPQEAFSRCIWSTYSLSEPILGSEGPLKMI